MLLACLYKWFYGSLKGENISCLILLLEINLTLWGYLFLMLT
ncbi:MAG: hypothetical protein ACI9N1_000787 [Flavobacteriales bacterium]|jgi:hypothetical protein